MTSTNGASLDFEVELRGAIDADNGSLTVPEAWEGFPGRAFGGFLAGAVLVAASARTEHPRPLSLFSRYYRPSPVGRAVRIELAAERRGSISLNMGKSEIRSAARSVRSGRASGELPRSLR